MIEILGVLEGQEFEAAEHLRRLLLNRWPDLAQSRDDLVKIFVGMKMHGYKVEDLDLIVIGRFAEPRQFDVEFRFEPREGKAFVPRKAYVRNFALVIEEKSHDAGGVRFDGTNASVRYIRNGRPVWEQVTEKNRLQMFEFKRFLAHHGVERVRLQNLVMFSGLRESQLPPRPHNCFGSDASFERVLNILGQVGHPLRQGHRAELIFGSDDTFVQLTAPDFPLFQTLEPTPLDRRRMDLIAKNAVSDTWLTDLGERQVLLKGRGGVGKTVILLQLAYRAYELRQYRSLLLTFNKALVADLRRTMALLGVPRSIESGGIGINTAHGYFGRLMLKLGIIDGYEDFLDRYDEHKANLLSYLQSGAISRADIDALIAAHPDEFDWDLLFVDEGQDWPHDEIAILRQLYDPKRITVSDGVDQFVRDAVADWTSGVAKQTIKVRMFKKCMRMKANVAAVVRDLAGELGIENWDLTPNLEAAGGRVIVVEGDLSARPDLLRQWAFEAEELGNHPVDLLGCVPPSMVEHHPDSHICAPALKYEAAGGEIWDGTARDIREHYPTRREQLRFVQYDSCRGLEGWTVIAYALDDFWKYKYSQWLTEGHEVDPLLASGDEEANLHASRWTMIPLTRAIDTLIINVGEGDSVIKDVLRRAMATRPDCIEWLRGSTDC